MRRGSVRVQRGALLRDGAAWLSEGAAWLSSGCGAAQFRVRHGSVQGAAWLS